MKMRTLLTIAFFCLLPVAGPAADEAPHAGHDRFPADYHQVETSPEAGEGITRYAEDDDDGAHSNFGRIPVHDDELFYTVRADRLEYQTREGEPALVWDVKGWIGRDYGKLYLESEGARLTDKGEFEEVEVEAFAGWAVSSFWDLRGGIRHDYEPDPERTFAAFGIMGLAPYWFETELTGYLSNHGNFQAKLELEYDLMLTQRLVLQPRLEAKASAQEVERHGEAEGLNEYELGLRLRYEIVREFAPYVGVSFAQKVGETGSWAEAEGEDAEKVSFVAGVRVWY